MTGPTAAPLLGYVDRWSVRAGETLDLKVSSAGPTVEVDVVRMFRRNVGLVGGVAPVRAYLPELLADVLSGEIAPGRVFDLELPLEETPEAYAAMDERRAIKALLRP